ADIILIDPHEAGGLWACIKAAGVAESAGIPVTLHAGGELGLSQAAYLHLAAAIPNLTIPIDSEYSYLRQDVITRRHEIRNGAMAVPTGPGLGVEVDVAALDAHRIDKVPLAYLDERRPDWFPEKPAY